MEYFLKCLKIDEGIFGVDHVNNANSYDDIG